MPEYICFDMVQNEGSFYSILTTPKEFKEKAMKHKIESRSISQNRSLICYMNCFLFRSTGGVFLDA